MARPRHLIEEMEDLDRELSKSHGQSVVEGSIIDIFRRALDLLPCEKFVVGGGILTHLYGEARFTKDIDFIVIADFLELQKALEKNGFDRWGSTPFECAIIHEYEYEERRLDLIEFKNKELTKFFLTSATEVTLFDRKVKVLSPEAFVISKLLSAGPKRMRDYDDISRVLEKTKVDMGIVKGWASKLKISKKLKILEG